MIEAAETDAAIKKERENKQAKRKQQMHVNKEDTMNMGRNTSTPKRKRGRVMNNLEKVFGNMNISKNPSVSYKRLKSVNNSINDLSTLLASASMGTKGGNKTKRRKKRRRRTSKRR